MSASRPTRCAVSSYCSPTCRAGATRTGRRRSCWPGMRCWWWALIPASYAGALAGVTGGLPSSRPRCRGDRPSASARAAFERLLHADHGGRSAKAGQLAEQVLAMAPSNTIAGTISIDPAAALDARFHPCPPDPTILHDPGLPGFWGIGATVDVPAAIQATVAALEQAEHQGRPARLRKGHRGTEMLLALTEPHLEPGNQTRGMCRTCR